MTAVRKSNLRLSTLLPGLLPMTDQAPLNLNRRMRPPRPQLRLHPCF